MEQSKKALKYEKEMRAIQDEIDAINLAKQFLDKEQRNSQAFANVEGQLYKDQWQEQANDYKKKSEILERVLAKLDMKLYEVSKKYETEYYRP